MIKYKKYLALILVVVMMTGLFSALGITAYAIEDVTVNAGENFGWYWNNQYDDFIIGASLTGNYPYGMSVMYKSNEFFYVQGNVPNPGTYNFTVVVNWATGVTTTHEYNLIVKAGNRTNQQVSENLNTGAQFSRQYRLSTGGQIYNHGYSGMLPPGLVANYYTDSIVISGTPSQSGTYSVNLFCYDEYSGANIEQPVIFYVQAGNVKVTKSPTGENVNEGENALFIAKAENETGITWRLVSPDSQSAVDITSAKYTFQGLDYYYYDEDHTYYLQLKSIPTSLNGWKVEARFTGEGGPVATNAAIVTVSEKRVEAPVIQNHPKSVESEMGKPVTLSVTATANLGVVSYQWYINSSNSVYGGKAIAGANTPTYTPQQIEGNSYYYVEISSNYGGKLSPSVTSSVATVTYKPSANPSPSPTPFVTPKPSNNPAQSPNPNQTTNNTSSNGTQTSGQNNFPQNIVNVTPEVTKAPTNTTNRNDRNGNSSIRIYMMLLVVCIVLIVLIFGFVVFLRLKENRERAKSARRRRQ